MYPVNGDEVSLRADVWNRGGADVAGADVHVYMLNASGNLNLLASEYIPYIASGSFESIITSWNSSGLTGRNNIVVVADPADGLSEVSESNNYATKEIIVTEGAGVSMLTSLDSIKYNSNQNVKISTTLINSGREVNGALKTFIEDEFGNVLHTFDPITSLLSYGSREIGFIWNTGSTYTGSYRVRTSLYGESEIFAENIAIFNIQPDVKLVKTAETNQAVYNADEDVNISINIANEGDNYVVPSLDVIVRIEDLSGIVMSSSKQEIYNLLPGNDVTLNSSWNTSSSSPGDYFAVVDTYLDGSIVAHESVSFDINGDPFISGEIHMTSPVVLIGKDFHVDYTLRNTGNAPSEGTVSIDVVEPETGNIVVEEKRNASLSVDSSQSDTISFSSKGLELRQYLIKLQHYSGESQKSIAGISFTVRDGFSPILIVNAPEEGREYGTPVIISAIATDDKSGVESVEYRIDNGEWRELSLADSMSGIYSASWNPPSGAGGEHVITFRSTDRSGNTSEEQSVAFIVQSDSAPPLTTMNFGELKYEVNDVIYVTGTSSLILNATDDDSGVAYTSFSVDGGAWITYVAPFGLSALTEGKHLIACRSTDNAGNVEDEKVISFSVDNTAPVTTLTLEDPKHVLEGGKTYITANTVVNLTATDNLSGVANTEYRVDGSEWTAYAPFNIKEEGNYLIEYRSSDNVGNIENLSSISVVVDNAVPLSEITVGEPKYESDTATLFVTGNTLFTITASDSLSGVKVTEYRIDGSHWGSYTPFQVSDEGEHLVEYRSIDNVGNVEEMRSLSVIIDNTPPVSTLSTGEPKYVEGGSLFITSNTVVTLAALDNLVGVAMIRYSLDGGAWTDYAPFKVEGEGSHSVDYRSEDNLGNVELAGTRTLIVDNMPPVSILDLGSPRYEDSEGRLFVSGITPFTLIATDELSGVANATYRLNDGEAQPYGIFAIPNEGEHVVAYGAVDNVDNAEKELSLAVTVDNTAPVTEINFSGQVYHDGDIIFITKETGVTLNATDNLSSVKDSYYLLDDGTGPEKFTGIFNLDAIGYGQHTVRFYSRDNVENTETEKSVTVVVVGIDVTTEVLNIPRALVWSSDPSKLNGSSRKDYTLDDIKGFVGYAFNDDDIYYTVVSDRDAFKSEFRSGIYNIFVIVDEDNPFGAQFSKEIREAVNGGAGLVISGWGNNITPKMEKIVGLNFKGSLSMDDDENSVQLYASDISGEEAITARGKILKTELDGAVLAGIVKGNEVCEGMRSIKLDYPVDLQEGDVVSVSLTIKGKGKKVTIVDEEELLVTALPMTEIFNNPGSESGDLAIASVNTDGVSISIAGFAGGYLAAEYDIEVSVNHEDGSIDETRVVGVAASCEGAPEVGMQAGPFMVAAVDRAVTTDLTDQSGKYLENLPALVLNEYGKGRAVMFTFNIVESAMNGDERFAAMLKNAVTYAKPDEETVEAADTILIEKKVTLYGAGMDIRTIETLDDRLDYLQLFDLNRDKLEYTFSLADGESHSYRYFMRMPDLAGDFFTETRAEIMAGGMYQFFDNYEDVLTVSDASSDILNSAMAWMESKLEAYPDEGDKISELKVLLEGINSLPKTDEDDLRKVIHDAVQFIDKLKQLSFDTSELRLLLDNYIKIYAGSSHSFEM
ncbi:MAG: Ig-like domain-containing protein [Bacteroidales bacterium]|nr:Ig-like domain-containing protein [Bacteroidales bacterium]